jgi:hypothetical protein
MVYLCVLTIGETPPQKLLNRVLRAYQRKYGPNVRVLGGMQVTGSLPRNIDSSVQTICKTVCEKNNVPFNSAVATLEYGVVKFSSEDTRMGVCRIYIGGKPTESAVWTEPFCAQCSRPLKVTSDEVMLG